MGNAIESGGSVVRRPKQILFDASHSFPTGKNSGIERVVRSLYPELVACSDQLGVHVPQMVTFHGDHFYRIDGNVRRDFSKLAAIESNIKARIPKALQQIIQWVSRRCGVKQLEKWFLPQVGHLGAFKVPHTIADRLLRLALPYRSPKLTIHEGDLVILPDAYWTRRGVWKAAQHARQQGAVVATLIYDLIPLTHPEFVGAKRCAGFREYLHHAIENSDILTSISATVSDELERYIDANRATLKRIPTHLNHFTLGAEFHRAKGEVRTGLKELFPNEPAKQQKPPYLMVATFDPRKNHRYLLDAFDRLWNDGSDAKLVLIGRVGSLCEDLIQRIQNHPQIGKQLFAFHDVQDFELQHCYQFCRGVLFPSIVEGFGLPIVESLWFGKRTFASDTPIHREVGKEDCIYFDLADPQSLATKIQAWEKQAENSELTLPTRRPFTWKESSIQFLSQILDVMEAKNVPMKRAA
ncbi:MAG: glycosyltransferase family 1 protein [Pirellulales bacterium]